MDIRTLCYRCASDYVDAGYELYKKIGLKKDNCDFCGRPSGCDYVIVQRKKDKEHGKR